MRPATSARAARPRRAPAVELDPAKVHAWRIECQLLGRRRGTSPADVATALVGVQAQVTSSAALAIALRSKAARGRPATVDATTRALAARKLVRSWAMRGTLHLFAAEDVPTIAAALGRREQWRRPAWLRWFDVTEKEMERLIDTIGEVLDDGVPRTRADLSVEVGRRMGENAGRLLLGSWGSALKIASERAYLCQSAEDGSGGAGVRFVKASRWLGSWREEDPDAALASLVERYLAAYGPATLKELLRWWGVAVTSAMRPVIERLGDAVAEVEVDGIRTYARAADIEAIESTRPKKGQVQLVGGFDPFIVGAGLREQLIPAADLKRVSRTAGWISPVVLVDGRVAGVWDSRIDRTSIGVTVELFLNGTPRLRASISAAAERIGAALDLPVSVAYGRVFMETKHAVPFRDR